MLECAICSELLWGIKEWTKTVEILLDTYGTITQMRIKIVQALNNCLIAS